MNGWRRGPGSFKKTSVKCILINFCWQTEDCSSIIPIFGKAYEGAREGLQKVEIRGKDVFVEWDVAHSMARSIAYSLYIKEGEPFDFNKDLESQSRHMEFPMGRRH